MTIYGIILIVAIVLAIPTYGLSLVVYYFLWRSRNSGQAQSLASAALQSLSQDKPVSLAFGHTAAVLTFFKNFGSTIDKAYTVKHQDGSESFFGYVVVADKPEFVVHALAVGRKIIVSSHSTPYNFGQDIVSLMLKKKYIDEIIDIFVKENPGHLTGNLKGI